MNVKVFKGSIESIKLVRNNLQEIIMYYGCATVADLYDLVGYTTTYTDSKYGWTSLGEVTIVMTDEIDAYELVLPEPKLLSNI